jgi:hypothetical protein
MVFHRRWFWQDGFCKGDDGVPPGRVNLQVPIPSLGPFLPKLVKEGCKFTYIFFLGDFAPWLEIFGIIYPYLIGLCMDDGLYSLGCLQWYSWIPLLLRMDYYGAVVFHSGDSGCWLVEQHLNRLWWWLLKVTENQHWIFGSTLFG